MMIKRRFLLICFLFVLSCTWIACQTQDYQVPPKHKESEIFAYAQNNLPHTGVLRQKEDGFVYLKVEDGYINQLYPLIKEKGYHRPPSLFRPNPIGAHISVFYDHESQSIDPIEELGQTFSFKPVKVRHVRTRRNEYIVLEVESPGLKELRKRYGLSPKLNHHQFHITIAQRKLYRN